VVFSSLYQTTAQDIFQRLSGSGMQYQKFFLTNLFSALEKKLEYDLLVDYFSGNHDL